MNLNSPSSPFPIHQSNDDRDQHRHLFGPNHQLSSSPSSVSCHIFFNSTQDHMGYYDHHYLYQPRQQEDDYNYAYHSGSSYEMKNKVEDQSGLKLTLWKKEDNHEHESILDNTNNPIKWMSSKMRLMKKMKNPDRVTLKITSSATTNVEDQKLQPSSSLETDLSNNSSSYNINNSPIRVCSDCNTTKTPLWRSGPKGPKSLCNACGIRQRKARRAMAAAASGTAVSTTQPGASMKIKVQHKEKIGKIGHASQLKKRCKKVVAATSPAASQPSINGQKKLLLEDFLINLSNNLSFHRVFPEDEKDAAILLMALSSGVVHG
ncbi:hypothetical protein BUALT_Bualt16G0052600 [Buddleja alternifolia]|uniref:GATA-type domain-containing protein n=1 Tax=Buddleja alternifolia TaxID=168488 RepID=A0AAV6WH21_9LAMI|nr:hypothetical protein BUALT_Bualt16G0052600 [Buddleja alternifolia]